MNAARKLWQGAALLAALSVVAGCGRAPLTPVNGRVTYKGYALQSGVIVFTPDATRGERGAIAVGRIREDGGFTLYSGDAPGATPGWYRITVSSLAASNFNAPSTQSFSNFPQSIIPEKYRDPELSLLVCEVKTGRTNSIDFNLE